MWTRFSIRYLFCRHYCKSHMPLVLPKMDSDVFSNFFPYFFIRPVISQECEKLIAELFVPRLVSPSTGFKIQQDHRQRRFSFECSVHEPLSTFFSHLISSINGQYLRGKTISTTDSVYLASKANLVYKNTDGSTTSALFSSDKTLGDCFLSESSYNAVNKTCQMLLQIRFHMHNDHEKTTLLSYTVHRNPAHIIQCRLNTVPMVGCPVVPLIEAENICLENSEFSWFVGQSNKWSEKPCHKGFLFIPTEDHIGLSIQLRIRVRDTKGIDGVPYGTGKFFDPYGEPIKCKSTVLKAPNQVFHQRRYDWIENNQLDSQHLRVVSYNILAEMYAGSDFARTNLFKHCPENFISSAYRLPLILRELCSYQSDFICLQEVDRWVYDKYLVHTLKFCRNMDGIFLAKRAVLSDLNDPTKVKTDVEKEKGEGCAIFYSRTRFELVSKCGLPSIIHYASTVPFLSAMLDKFNSTTSICATAKHSFSEEDTETHIQKSLSQCLITGVFREKSATSQSLLLIVSNAHLYFHPSASQIRTIQAFTVRHYLSELAMCYKQSDNKPIPIVFCGDINQSPDSDVFTALTQGNECSSHEKITYQPIFESAYANNSPEFTNWVPGFHAVLDVILYNADSDLRCTHALPIGSLKEIKELLIQLIKEDNQAQMLDLNELGLPNAYFPSDHIALVADFSWDSLKPTSI
ncbi:2',5'-phosphodiesterase 12 [Schistosoma japonicum]|nr:2',5'-phosphodiesterase 12 [Schistosoma japonicum]